MGNGSAGGGHRPAAVVAIGFPLFLFTMLLLLGVVGFAAAVSAYSAYSQGLPDPKTEFGNLTFDEQTVVLDRTGKVELARFGSVQRQVIDDFTELSPVLVDATTSIEDKTFWSNAGFDPIGIVSAAIDTASGRDRGASTITQQLVRNRLLPESAFAGTKYERKIREIIQSIRLTQEYPGISGKQQIMVAYLNQNYYGDQSYGVASAAHDYFGVNDLHQLTIAQAAILAAIPQSPSTYDLRQNAVEVPSADGKTLCPYTAKADITKKCTDTVLQVPNDSKIVERRNDVLDKMLVNRHLTLAGDPLATGTPITDAQITAALSEPAIIKPPVTTNWKAPQFDLQVRHQLGVILCGEANADNCPAVDKNGYQVTTTLDWKMQQVAEKWTKAAGIAPNAPNPAAYLKANHIPNQRWIRNLIRRGVYNAALAALDYRTGQVYAYVGSADFYAKPRGKKFQPQFDVLSDGWRQPGSSFKPINYITGIDDHTHTAASLYMDVTTNFGGGYAPVDADHAERGPLRMRQAIQMSLNIPAVKNAAEVGPDHVFAQAEKMGIVYRTKTNPAGVSIGIGTVELHYADLLSAYGAIADGGVLMPRTFILQVRDSNGNLIYPAPGSKPVTGTQVVSPQAAYVMTSIIAGNTDPSQNPWWSERKIMDHGVRRPATLKTGTTNDEIDLAAFGYLAPPTDPKAPALAVGAWMGNSDNSIPPRGTVALETAASLWQAFLTEASKGMPIAQFKAPPGIVKVAVDANSGMLPGPFTHRTFTENFIKGTQPTQHDDTKVGVAIDAASGLLWQDGCIGPEVTKGFLDLSHVDAAFPSWQKADNAWIARARRGVGVRGGPRGTITEYFNFGPGAFPFGATWGAPFAPTKKCTPGPAPTPTPSCDPVFGCPIPSEPPGGGPGPSPHPYRAPERGRLLDPADDGRRRRRRPLRSRRHPAGARLRGG